MRDTKKKRLPRGKVTVDEVLQLDDINGVITYLSENKHRIQDVCCVVMLQNGNLETKSTSTPLANIVAMLEMAKALIMQIEWFGLENEE